MARGGYAVGDWCAVPLADGSFAPARVVRLPARHYTLTYVFAPRTVQPALEEVRDLDPGDALLAVKVSGLHIGVTWPLLGGRDDFDPRAWPVPELESEVQFPDGPRLRVDRLDESLRRVETFHVPMSERGNRQRGSTMGAGALEKWMPLQVAQGTLRPVREQVWWPAGLSAGAVESLATPAGGTDGVAPNEDLPPDQSLVVVVLLPGRDGAEAARAIEPRLRRKLRRVAEVDGTMMNADSGEVWIYADDLQRTVEAIRTALRRTVMPEGSHLLVRAGDDDQVPVEL